MGETVHTVRGLDWRFVRHGTYVAEFLGARYEVERRGREPGCAAGWFLFGPDGQPFGQRLVGDRLAEALADASRVVVGRPLLDGPKLTAARERWSRSLAALACMRRSGESAAALRRRDAEIARLEQLLDLTAEESE